MKRTLLLIIFILSFLNAIDAQWYNRSCGVIDINNTTSEEFECLWNKSTNMVQVGAITTAIGTSLLVIGFMSLAHTHTFNDIGTGTSIVAGGIIIDSIGYQCCVLELSENLN